MKKVVDRETYRCYYVFTRSTHNYNTAGGDPMPDKIVDILKRIEDVKGEEYAKGLVDGVNLATKEPAEKEQRPA